MDTLKKVLPLGGSTKDESGREPVSGIEGQATAMQLHDAGNQEDNPQLARKAPQYIHPEETPAPAASAAATETSPTQPADSKSGQLAETTSNNTSGHTESSPKLNKKPTIGSSQWFTNADPFSKDTSTSKASAEQAVDPKMPSSDKEQARTGAEREETSTPDSPPNHLGEDVPPGMSSVVVDPSDCVKDPAFYSDKSDFPHHFGESAPPGQLANKGKGKAKMTDADFDQESSSAASNRSTWTRNESVGTDYTITSKNTYSTAGTGASTLGSRRQSAAQAPHSQGKTLTAGGIPLGQRAMLEREWRLSSVITERDFGKIDDITSSSTQRLSEIGISDSGPSLSKHQDFGTPTRSPASSPPTANEFKATRVSSVDSKAAESPTEAKANRRHSSVVERAKGLGRKFSQRIKPSK